jgi:hypothetical protein
VVVDVGLALVLVARIFVFLVLVLDGRMVVLVLVRGREMAPVPAVGQIVDHVMVRVPVDHVVVPVAIRHGASLLIVSFLPSW